MALRDSGLFVLLAVSTAALISGCVPYYEDYQWIERSDQYIAPAVLAEIWQRHLTRSEVIGRVGPIYPDDQTDRAIGYLRCALPGVSYAWHGRAGVRDCQMVGVWFDEAGHAIEVQSLLRANSDSQVSGWLARNGGAGGGEHFKRWGPGPGEPSKTH